MAFLYFIQCGDETGPIKIGQALDADRRRNELQIGCPYPLRLLSKVWLGENAERFEESLHEALREHHLRGEWFTAAIMPIARDAGRLAARAMEALLRQPEADVPIEPRPRRGEFVWRGKSRPL